MSTQGVSLHPPSDTIDSEWYREPRRLPLTDPERHRGWDSSEGCAEALPGADWITQNLSANDGNDRRVPWTTVLTWLYCMCMVFCLCDMALAAKREPVGPQPAARPGSPPRVLVLNSYHPRYVWGDAVMRGISEMFQQELPEAELRYEYLDTKHYPPTVVFGPMQKLLLAKYKETGLHFDVIISTDDNALDFLALYRDEIFPGTPVVFCGTNKFNLGRLRGKRRFTGVIEHYDLKGTLELAHRLHPDATHWALVSGMSTSSLINQDRFYSCFHQFRDDVSLIDLSRLNVDEMIDRLQKLPEKTVIIYLSWYQMPDGTFLSVRESTSLVLKYGNRPMYSPWDYTMGHGVIGGHVLRASQHGSEAATLALKILKGTSVNLIPIRRHPYFSYLFDYGMLERFGIPISVLPVPHEFINEPDTLYYRYKKQLWIITGVIVYLLITIFVLLRSIARRKAVEANLRLNESRLEALLELNQAGDISLPGIIRMVLGKAVELTKSEVGFLLLMGGLRPLGYACILHDASEMSFHALEEQTLEDLRHTEVVKDLRVKRTPIVIDDREDLKMLQQRCFPGEHKPLRHFAVLPVMREQTFDAVVGVGNKRTTYDGTDFRQQRLLVEGMLALIRSRRAKEREERLEAQLHQAQKMEAIGTFAGGIAHDFNNILGGISSCSELALTELPEDNVAREDIRQVLKASERGKSLVRQILTFSRKKQEPICPVDLRQVLTETMALVRSLMPENVAIRENLPDHEVIVAADSTQIQQLVLNLCANAEQAMRGKHGVLQVGLNIANIDARTAETNPDLAEGPHALINVTDTGVGIPPEVLPRIFEPFFTTHSHKGGTGLGLSVSHGIICRHLGAVTVDSVPGQGTTFQVYVPISPIEHRSIEQEREDVVRGGNERILLVDDNQAMRYALTKYLTSLGYTVCAYGNGKEAFNAFRHDGTSEFDLVVTDQSMPQMTGIEFAKQIREINTQIPVILFSGFLGQDFPDFDSSDTIRSAVQSILSKPFTNEDLGLAVRAVLDKAASAHNYSL